MTDTEKMIERNLLAVAMLARACGLEGVLTHPSPRQTFKAVLEKIGHGVSIGVTTRGGPVEVGESAKLAEPIVEEMMRLMGMRYPPPEPGDD